MPVPEEIRSVPRPKNTIVKLSANNKYIVIERIGCKRINGKNIPINGKTIGYIIDGKYVPKQKQISVDDVEIKTYAPTVLINQLNSDLLNDLQEVFAYEDALKIYCMAILKVVYPDLNDSEISNEYSENFLSELYKNVALSKNTVSTFQEALGKNYSRVVEFMRKRILKVANHTIIVDGVLKTNNSKINNFSEFSRKGRIKSSKDISLIFAYDDTLKEPVYQMVVPGNMLDLTSFSQFIAESQLKNGIIIADKGFKSNKEMKEFSLEEGLHYLIPLKRSAKKLVDLKCYDNYELLPFKDKTILGKKINDKGVYYYSFKDVEKTSLEEKCYLNNRRDKKDFNEKKYLSKKVKFGTIVYESDYDLTLEEAFKMYKTRWEIELIFKQYKNIIDLSKVKVHNDYSLLGKEFINFVSVIMTCRVRDKFEESGLFEKYSFKQILHYLKKSKKLFIDNEWKDLKKVKYIEEIIDNLHIV